MLLPFPRYMVAGVSQGARVQGDAEIDLPATVVPTAIVGTPIDESAIMDLNTIMRDSFFGRVLTLANTGIGGGLSSTGELLGKGLWHIAGTLIMQFTGTANFNSVLRLALTDTQNASIHNIAEARAIAPLQLVVPVELWLSLRADGCAFRLHSPVTVAGDNQALTWRYLATKVF